MPDHPPVTVTFLGGLGEVGRNMAAIEVDGSIAVIDVGVFFPNAEHLGVDLILPDWRILVEPGDLPAPAEEGESGASRHGAGGRPQVEALFLTHGHLDHIGGVPYFLRDFPDVTVFGTRLTLAFVEAMLEEWDDLGRPELVEVAPGDVVEHGPFTVEVVQVSHSIPDGAAFAFRTPHGLVVHSGDFKMDQTPVDGLTTDLAHFARLGDEGVDLLLADSTNADVPGHVPTERTVGASLRDEIAGAQRLVVVTSFASHVHRIQQVLDAARDVGRRPVFVGRSMVRNMGIAQELGYIDYEPDDVVDPDEVADHDPASLIVVCTGSQGEPYSALSLMAAGDHRQIEVGDGDLVILASSLIPGNEQAIFRSINGLARRGCRVVHKGVAEVHVSGHASRDDLVLFHNLLEPEYVVPVHGEYRHLSAHREIAIATGCPAGNVLICEDGDVVVLEGGRVTRGERVPAGQILIDGLLLDVGPAVLRDRRRLSEDGICVCVVTVDIHQGRPVGETLLVQRGVVFHEEADDILAAATKAVDTELGGLSADRFADLGAVERHVTQALGTYWRAETGRRPMIVPIVLDA